jgi:hypothetical protein
MDIGQLQVHTIKVRETLQYINNTRAPYSYAIHLIQVPSPTSLYPPPPGVMFDQPRFRSDIASDDEDSSGRSDKEDEHSDEEPDDDNKIRAGNDIVDVDEQDILDTSHKIRVRPPHRGLDNLV